MKHRVLALKGADCPSCVFTIEYSGRKLKGVEDVYVDISTHKIHVDFQGDDNTVLEGIRNIVRKLGYSAKILTDD